MKGTTLILLILSVVFLVEVNIACDIRMEVNVNVGGGKKHVSIIHEPQQYVNTKVVKHTQVVNSEIVSESRDVIQTAKNTIPKANETVIAEKYLEFASKIQEIYNQIPSNDKTNDLKKLLASYIQLFSKNSKHPTSDILKGSLNDIAMKSESPNSAGKLGAVSFEESSNPGAKTLINFGSVISSQIGRITGQMVGQISSQIGQTIGGRLGGVSNSFTPEQIRGIIDRMGSYSGGMNLVGIQLGTNIADVLTRMGFPQSSQIASLLGKSITNFSQTKLAPLEANVKSKVMPRVLKSSTPITESIGLLTKSIGKSSAFKTVSLPPKFQEMKSSLKKTINQLRNTKPLVHQTKPSLGAVNNKQLTSRLQTKPIGNPNRPSTPSKRPSRISNPSPSRISKSGSKASRISNPSPRPAIPVIRRTAPTIVHRAPAAVHRAPATVSRRR